MTGKPPANHLVSVIIPVFNAVRTIEATLASALRQTYPSLEVIVVDDGSSDGTAAIVEAKALTDPRIRLIRQRNAGVAAARNYGLAMAAGDLIAPLDADDLWHRDKIARQVRRFDQAGGHTGVVYCWSTDIGMDDRIVAHRLDLDRFEGNVLPALILGNFLGNASVPLIRRSELEAVGGWDPALRAQGAQGCEDWSVYLRLAQRCEFSLEPAFLVGYRQVPGAMSRNIEQMHRSFRLVMEEARRSSRDLDPRLFLWSAAAFDLYMGELEWGAARHLRSLRFMASGILKDPTWLTRRSSRKKLKGHIGLILRGITPGIARPRVPASPPIHPYPIGLSFHDLPPDVNREFSEGRAISRRRELLMAHCQLQSVDREREDASVGSVPQSGG
jgi:glycosyltransferase involved in cell wall biosynthesis